MGHIKIIQIRIHLIKNVEKYIGTCITKFLFPNPSPIIEMPHDEFPHSSSLGCIAFLLILLFKQSLQLTTNHSSSFRGPHMRIASIMSYRSSPSLGKYLPTSLKNQLPSSSLQQLITPSSPSSFLS